MWDLIPIADVQQAAEKRSLKTKYEIKNTKPAYLRRNSAFRILNSSFFIQVEGFFSNMLGGS